MATTEQIALLRQMIDEPTSASYTDVILGDMIDQAENNLDAAAASIWDIKAARYSRLVNTSESGSSRAMGDLYKNALAMARHFGSKVTEVRVAVTSDAPRTRTAVRK